MADEPETMKPIPPNDQDKYNQQIIQFRVDPDTGFYTLSCSTDNGLHYQVILTADGRKFSDKDAASFWPFLKKYVSSLIDGVTIEWAEVKGKPEVITKEQLEERLAKLAIPTSFSWNDITDKPKLALKDDIPSLDGYAKLTDIPSVSGLVKEAELADYAKLADVPKSMSWNQITGKPILALKSDIPNVSGFLKQADLDGYAKKSDIPKPPDLSGYAKLTDIPKPPDLTPYAKTSEVDEVKATADSALSNAEKAQSTAEANSKALANKIDRNELPVIPTDLVHTSDLSSYALKSELPKTPDLSGYALKSELPSLDGYAKLTDIPSVAGLVKEAELADYAKKSDLPNLSGYVKVSDLIDYAKKTDIPQSLSWDKVTGKPDVALKSELPSITGLAKETDLASVKATAESAESKAEQAQSTADANSRVLETKADKSELPDISGLAKKSDIPAPPDLSSYAKLTDVPSITGLVKEAELADYAKRSDLPVIPTDLVHTADISQVKADASQAKQDAAQALTIAKSASATIDTDNLHQIKKPSEYSEGFSYEVKALSDLGIDLTKYDTSVQNGWIGLVKSAQVSVFNSVYVTQTVRVLGSYRPTTFIRNGSGDSWYPFELVTTW